MTSPLTADLLTGKPLFHKAIIHSGVFDSLSLDDGEKTGYSLSGDKHINCLTDPNELKCLRDTPAENFVKAMGSGGRGLDPIIDGYVLDPSFGSSPTDVVRNGFHYPMPVLIGNVVEEVSWTHYDDSKDLHTEGQYIDMVNKTYKPNADGVLKHYPTGDYLDVTPDWVDGQGALRLRITLQPSPRQAYNAIKADKQFVCPARTVLKELAQHALSANRSDFVGRFLYTHTFLGGLKGSSGFYGASHGFDLAFVFGKPAFDFLGLTPTPDELTLKAKFQQTWADFARSGSPGGFWDRYDPSRDNYVMFNAPMSSGSQPRKKQCDYWDKTPPPG